MLTLRFALSGSGLRSMLTIRSAGSLIARLGLGVSECPSVRVSERRFQPAWETQVPYGLIEDRQHTFQPQRSTILYGDRYIGWEVLVEPRALKQGKHYIVTVWSDGGEGIIDMIGGAPLPKCPSDR